MDRLARLKVKWKIFLLLSKTGKNEEEEDFLVEKLGFTSPGFFWFFGQLYKLFEKQADWVKYDNDGIWEEERHDSKGKIDGCMGYTNRLLGSGSAVGLGRSNDWNHANKKAIRGLANRQGWSNEWSHTIREHLGVPRAGKVG